MVDMHARSGEDVDAQRASTGRKVDPQRQRRVKNMTEPNAELLEAMRSELDDLRSTVRALSDREQIFDCLHRFNRGLDRLDADSVRSAYFADAFDNHGPLKGDPEAFVRWVMPHMRGWDASLHLLDLNNLTIDGDAADSECYVLFMQRRVDGTVIDFGGARYLDHLERRDGEWRITDRTLIVDWTANADVTLLPDTAEHRPGARDRTDPSYLRPFVFRSVTDPSREG
jgi:SnoaL-like protein